MRRIALLSIAFVLAATAVPAAGSMVDDRRSAGPLDASVITPPSPVTATDDRVHLVYEVLLNNDSRARVRLDRVDVRDAMTKRIVQGLGPRRIEAQMFRYTRRGPRGTQVVRPGDFAVLMLDVRFPRGVAIPTQLDHRVALTVIKPEVSRRMKATIALTSVGDLAPAELGPPLRENNLAVIGCCSVPFAHRLALLGTYSGPVIAQRYAIDFVKVSDEGLNTYEGDPADNNSYLIYGAELLAVADAEVVSTRETMSENTPPGAPPGAQLNDAAGNNVVLDLGDGRFALYAHLQPDSVQVEPGDVVEEGQVIGLVGNSGNSTEPHLHFHVMDGAGGASRLEADGVPYVFEAFQMVGRIEGLDGRGEIRREPAPAPVDRVAQFMLTGDLVTFP